MSAASPSYLLDTSALLTLLEDEAGAGRIERLLKQSAALICAVSLLEVRYITLQERTEAEADVRHALFKRSGATILVGLGRAHAAHRGQAQSGALAVLADAIIAASAYRHGAILLHKDPEFHSLPDFIQQERLPYKPTAKAG